MWRSALGAAVQRLGESHLDELRSAPILVPVPCPRAAAAAQPAGLHVSRREVPLPPTACSLPGLLSNPIQCPGLCGLTRKETRLHRVHLAAAVER